MLISRSWVKSTILGDTVSKMVAYRNFSNSEHLSIDSVTLVIKGPDEKDKEVKKIRRKILFLSQVSKVLLIVLSSK